MEKKEVVNSYYSNINEKMFSFFLKNPIKFMKMDERSTNLSNYINLLANIESFDKFDFDFFQSINLKYDFEKTFPFLSDFIKTFENQLSIKLIEFVSKVKFNNNYFEILISKEIDSLILNLIHEYLSIYGGEKELIDVLGSIWSELSSKFDGYTTVHIILVVILTYHDIENIEKELEKLKLDKNLFCFNKNILLWSALFHDIAKHIKHDVEKTKPCLYDKKCCGDKIHPFKSGIYVLNYFANDLVKKYELIINKNEFKEEIFIIEDNYSKINSLMNKSFNYTYFSRKRINVFLHSNDYLQDIGTIFNEIKGLGSKFIDNSKKDDFKAISIYLEFIRLVFILVSFHQSLPNCKDHMNDPLLNEKEIKLFFNKESIEMMRLLMINDSISHARLSGKNFYEKEINTNLNILYSKSI